MLFHRLYSHQQQLHLPSTIIENFPKADFDDAYSFPKTKDKAFFYAKEDEINCQHLANYIKVRLYVQKLKSTLFASPIETPTINRKNGITKSAKVRPFHGE